MTTINDIRESYEWGYVFSYSNGKSLDKKYPDFPFGMDDISKILHIDDGENDGLPWIIMVKLKNKSYGFATAWCDYTGFDCQSGGSSYVSKSKKKLIRYGMGEDDRKRLGLSLSDDFNNGRKE